MNFFGHAAVASRFSDRPAFLLGAMLPDFCGMLSLRAPAVGSLAVADGVRFHHETDGVFHDLPLFRGWCREALAHLSARGVARGTARAVAHVGLEFLLDAALAENEGNRAAYRAGLRAGANPVVLEEIGWQPEPRARLAELVGVLEQRSLVAKVPAKLVAERLERTLARRPRLAIVARDREPVVEWVELFQHDVVASAPRLVAELVGELERRRAA
jgi:hypothetical protein